MVAAGDAELCVLWPQVMDFLLSKEAKLDATESGQTILHAACQSGTLEAVQVALNACKELVEKPDNTG